MDGVARILVIRRRAFGDLLLSLPALHALRDRFPSARIDLVMDPALVEIAARWSRADSVIPFPDRSSGPSWSRPLRILALARRLARNRYDTVVDLHSTPQTAWLAHATGAARRIGLDLPWRRWAYTDRVRRTPARSPRGVRPETIPDALGRLVEPLGVPPARNRVPIVPRGEDEGAEVPRSGGPRIAVAPGATWPAKRWPVASYRRTIEDLLQDETLTCTVFWGPGEKSYAERVAAGLDRVRLAPGGSLLELAARLRTHDVFLSGDSGARHLAIAVGLPSVTVFGSTDPWTVTPGTGEHRWFRYRIACAPCQRTECALRENYCMTRVDPVRVAEAVRETWEHHAHRTRR